MFNKTLTDIDAEVRYAVRHEYAQKAVDVIARRTRLSFLNAQAALDALPQVVDILAEELQWDQKRKKQEIEDATEFLASMGLPPNAAPRASMTYKEESRGVFDLVQNLLGLKAAEQKRPAAQMMYSQAQFEAGEVEEIRRAFIGRAETLEPSTTQSGLTSPTRLQKAELFSLVKSLPGFEGIKSKDYDYVLEEAGYSRQNEVDFDEFMEVRVIEFIVFPLQISDLICRSKICAELREVLSTPAPSVKHERMMIPVEKSGGGV
jgi:glycerol-3-phosphate dehydrogenase